MILQTKQVSDGGFLNLSVNPFPAPDFLFMIQMQTDLTS